MMIIKKTAKQQSPVNYQVIKTRFNSGALNYRSPEHSDQITFSLLLCTERFEIALS
jgi:hypothetical protein